MALNKYCRNKESKDILLQQLTELKAKHIEVKSIRRKTIRELEFYYVVFEGDQKNMEKYFQIDNEMEVVQAKWGENIFFTWKIDGFPLERCRDCVGIDNYPEVVYEKE